MPRPASYSRPGNLKQENPMNVNHYIGFDVHKKSISYCVKGDAGTILEEGKLPAKRAPAQRALARGDGSDAVQRLGLRHLETVCRGAADGTSGDDESHRRVEKEERPVGRAEDRRPGALPSAAGMLRGAGGVAGVAAAAALPQPGVGPGGADEEQDERAVDGSRRGVQQAAATWGEVFHDIAGPSGRSAGIGEGSAAAEPRRFGEVRDHATTVAGQAGEASQIGGEGEAAEEHSGSGRGHGVDVGAGGGRAAALSLDCQGSQLLRVYFGTGQFGGQRAPRADFQTAQRALADGAGGSGQVGAAVEPATGGGPRAGSAGKGGRWDFSCTRSGPAA